MAHEEKRPFAHLSSDLTAQEEEALEIDDADLEVGELLEDEDEHLVVPVVDDLEAPPALPLLSSMPTQIVRAHKVLDRARMKRAERIEEGRTLIIDHDKPPPAPPKPAAQWSWITMVVLFLAFGSVGALIMHQVTQSDVMEESLASDSVMEEALAEEPAPPPPIKRVIAVEEQKIELPVEKPVEKPVVEKRAVEKAPEPKKVAPVLKAKPREPVKVPKVEEVVAQAAPDPAPEVVPEPEKQPELPASGFISINATQGAKVEIDSREVGVAPLQKIELQPGRHAIWVTLSGHEVFQKDVLIKRGETTSLDVKLVPIPSPALTP